MANIACYILMEHFLLMDYVVMIYIM